MVERCLDKSPLHDDYKPLDTPSQWVPLEPCPVCGSEAALWQYSTSETAPRKLLVCCTHGDAIGPQDGLTNEGCLLYMPPDSFYRETIRDAVRYWNEFAKALTALRTAGVDGMSELPAGTRWVHYLDKDGNVIEARAADGVNACPAPDLQLLARQCGAFSGNGAEVGFTEEAWARFTAALGVKEVPRGS